MSMRKVGDARAVRLYGLRDQKVTPEMMVPALLNGALPQELTDPQSPHAMLVIKENPDLAKYYAQPAKTAEAAETLAHWAEYPFRYGLVMGIDDPHERVRYADHLDQLWQQANPQAAEPEPMTGVESAVDHSEQFEPAPQQAPVAAPLAPSMPMQPPPGPAPAARPGPSGQSPSCQSLRLPRLPRENYYCTPVYLAWSLLWSYILRRAARSYKPATRV